MNQYESPRAELIEFESEMVLQVSGGCTCQDVTANEALFVCESGSLDNSYDTSEEE